MQCPNCGNEYDDALAVCPFCGGGVQDQESPEDWRRIVAEHSARNLGPGPQPVGSRSRPVQGRAALRGRLINTHLLGAILATLFCCMPFGIVAIVYATMADSRLNSGDARGAKALADKAGGWLIASIVCGLVAIVLGTILGVLTGLHH